jgi:histone acetyltransferase
MKAICAYLSSDLNTMTSRLKAGYYNCLRLFIADMRRIFNNCKMFNERNSDYVRSASILDKVFIGKMKDLKLWIDFS